MQEVLARSRGILQCMMNVWHFCSLFVCLLFGPQPSPFVAPLVDPLNAPSPTRCFVRDQNRRQTEWQNQQSTGNRNEWETLYTNTNSELVKYNLYSVSMCILIHYWNFFTLVLYELREILLLSSLTFLIGVPFWNDSTGKRSNYKDSYLSFFDFSVAFILRSGFPLHSALLPASMTSVFWFISVPQQLIVRAHNGFECRRTLRPVRKWETFVVYFGHF